MGDIHAVLRSIETHGLEFWRAGAATAEFSEMTKSIDGALYSEVAGSRRAAPMVFLHPNPMDSSCWLYQMAHFSTWYRCIAVDLPGYGRSPRANGELSLAEVADACWEVVDRRASSGAAVLVGSSIGSHVAQYMYHARPNQTLALVLSGTGWPPVPQTENQPYVALSKGLDNRYSFTLQDFGTEFGEGELAHWLARLLVERNASADLGTILNMWESLWRTHSDSLHTTLFAPVLILAGSEDARRGAALSLYRRLPNAQFRVIESAGHACHFEKPWAFDAEVIRFLRDRGHGHSPLPEIT